MRSDVWKWGAVLLVTPFFGWYLWSDNDTVGVGVNGVNHMRNGNAIGQFYINGGAYGSIGDEGGGGSHMCCVMLPSVWRPGLQVEIRWELIDESVKKQISYKAQVPVEKYDEVGDLVVHFFNNNKVRVVSSPYHVGGVSHPVSWHDKDGGNEAVQGYRIPAIFTPEELAQLDRRDGK